MKCKIKDLDDIEFIIDNKLNVYDSTGDVYTYEEFRVLHTSVLVKILRDENWTYDRSESEVIFDEPKKDDEVINYEKDIVGDMEIY